jgi:hypothetical protein
MDDVGIIYDHLVYIFYGIVVHKLCGYLVYFMVIWWYIFPCFGTLYQRKYGNPPLLT